MTAVLENELVTEIDVLDQIDNELAQAAADYEQLIVARHRGDPMTAEHIASVLAKAGKTTTDLRNRVAELKERDQLQAIRRKKQENDGKATQLHGQIAEHAAKRLRELQALEEKLFAEILPARQELETINAFMMANTDLERKLRDCAANQPLVSRERNLESALARIAKQLAPLQSEQTRLTRLLDALNGGAKPIATDSTGWTRLGRDDRPMRQDEAMTAQQKANITAMLERLPARIKELTDEHASVTNELQAVRAEMFGTDH